MNRIHYAKPFIADLEVEYATDAARNGWGEKCYEYIFRLEESFCRHLGSKHGIATSSCTGALHLGMAGIEIGPGDEVILADVNWTATAAPITYLGATPVFVDVLPDTWCIDPARVEEAITPRTKAIIATHIYGNLCEMDRLCEIGEQYGVTVFEDAAEAIGSVYEGRRAGTIGKFGTFSFHGAKTLTTGEGGMFVTQDDELYERVLTLSNHGRSRNEPRQFWPEMIGYKYKMANVQAAIGCAQVERIDEILDGKRRVMQYYREQLASLPLEFNVDTQERRNGCWMPTIVFDKKVSSNRDELLQTFRENNIDARVFFWPLSMLDHFESKPENEVSYSIHARGLNLPSYHDLTQKEMDRVCNLVKDHLAVKSA